MRLALLSLGVLPGCFVITPGDLYAHDTLEGDWAGEWEEEDGELEGEIALSIEGEDWDGELELEGDGGEAELHRQREGDELTMTLSGDEPVEFEMELEAELRRVDRIEGDCVLWLGENELPCTFSLRRL
jgi:hypothetical protein